MVLYQIFNDDNFTNLTQSGIYYDTLQSVNGCDSIIELTLTVTSVGIIEVIDNGQLIIESVEIFNIMGQILLSYKSLPIDLPLGVYLIRIHTTRGIITKKIIKNNIHLKTF